MLGEEDYCMNDDGKDMIDQMIESLERNEWAFVIEDPFDFSYNPGR
jgi:hypothetical protein